MSRVRFCCAALAGITLLAAAQVHAQADETVTYDTESGPLTLGLAPDSMEDVVGVYPDYDGHIAGKMIELDRIEGTWWQSKASSELSKCKTAFKGTSYWGKFVLVEDADHKGFHGKWGSCDEAPSGAWNGKLRP